LTFLIDTFTEIIYFREAADNLISIRWIRGDYTKLSGMNFCAITVMEDLLVDTIVTLHIFTEVFGEDLSI